MANSKLSLSNNDKMTIISNFATLLSAGISILEAIDSLLEDAKGNPKKLLETLRADLVQGNHVYATFSKFPMIFDKVTVNIIKASEEAGTLDITLKDLKQNIQKDMEFTDKIKSALTYPIVILFVFIGVLLTMLVVVIPKISSVFSRLNVPLPLPTKFLIFLSSTLLNYTIPVILGIAILAILLSFLYKANKGLILGLLFSIPIVSGLIKEIDLTRFSRSLYLLLNAGIPIVSALDLTQDVVMRRDLQQVILDCKTEVLSGKRLSDGLRHHKGTTPSIMVKIIEAGEKSGSLDKSALEVSEYFDYQVTNRLRTVTALLEPIMLVFTGVLVGGMMLAIIAPIYGLIGQVGQH